MPFTPDPNFSLSSERLYISYLIPSNPAHCQFMVDLYNSDLFIDANGKTGVDTQEKAKAHIEGFVAMFHEKNGYGMYLLSLKGTSEPLTPGAQPIGIVTLMRGHYTAPDIGFALLPAYTHAGYATEAGKFLLQHAITPKESGGFGLPGVFGFTGKDNVKSQQVCKRLGLEYRGLYPLEAFNDEESTVWAMENMGEDLKEYGIKAERIDKA